MECLQSEEKKRILALVLQFIIICTTSIKAEACFTESLLPVSNAKRGSCLTSNGNVTCPYTCNIGYVYYDGNTTKTYSCSGKNEWFPSSEPEDCLSTASPSYIASFNVEYSIDQLASSCLDVFKMSIAASNSTIAGKVDAICKVLSVGSFVINSFTATSLSFEIYVKFNGEFVGEKSDSSRSLCITLVVASALSYNTFKHAITVKCPSGTATVTVQTVTEIDSGNKCLENMHLINTVSGNQQCVPCPQGMYFNVSSCQTCPDGQYQDAVDQTSCRSCPLNTVSRNDRTGCTGPPTKPVISLQGNLINQRQHNLTCTALSTSVPNFSLPLTYNWTVDGAAITDPRFVIIGSGNSMLMINTVQKQDKGKRIQCTATEEKGMNSEASDETILDVMYQPSIEYIPRVIVNESQRVTLTRRVSSNPLSNVDWYSGTELVKTQASVEFAVLTLEKVLCTDTKNFTIVASNGIQNNATSVVELLVNCKPYPDSNNITLDITDAIGIQFSTTVIAYPQPQCELKYDNGTKNSKMTEVLSHNAVNNITVHYNQTTVQHSDYGVYRLEVRNSFGTSTVFVNVIPHRKPNSPTNIKVTCEITQAKVQWKSSFDGGASQSFTAFALSGEQETRRSAVVQDAGEDVIHSVSVSNLQPSTSYIFYVSAENMHGEKLSTTSSCTTLKGLPGTDSHQTAVDVGSVVGAAIGSVAFILIVVVLVIFLRRRYTCIMIRGKELNSTDFDKDHGSHISMAEQNKEPERGVLEEITEREDKHQYESVYEEMPEREDINQYQELSAKGNHESKKQTYDSLKGDSSANKHINLSAESEKQDHGNEYQTYNSSKTSVSADEYINTSIQN